MRTLILILLLSGCSGFNPLDLLGSGVNTAANTQVGKENTQTIGVSTQQKFAPQSITLQSPSTEDQTVRPQARPAVQTPRVEQIQNQVNNELPTWVWVMLILVGIVGWLTDHPGSYIEKHRLRKRIRELESRT